VKKIYRCKITSVAECGSGMLIPDPDFYPFRIQKQQQKKERWKKLVVLPFLRPQISHSLKLFYFGNAEEKNLAQFSKNYRTFYSKIVTKLSKIWVCDPKSNILVPEKPYPGSRGEKAPDPGSGSATLLLTPSLKVSVPSWHACM
jgi:hypothetical protein